MQHLTYFSRVECLVIGRVCQRLINAVCCTCIAFIFLTQGFVSYGAFNPSIIVVGYSRDRIGFCGKCIRKYEHFSEKPCFCLICREAKNPQQDVTVGYTIQSNYDAIAM